MNKPQIDIFIAACDVNKPYAEFLKRTGELLQSGNYKLNWKCAKSDDGPPPDGWNVVSHIPNKNCNITRYQLGKVASYDSKDGYVPVTGKLSHGETHGAGLNACLDHIKADYAIIMDADVALLYPSWDSIIVQELSEYDCFGADFSTNSYAKWRYKNFPSLFFFCFRPYILDKVKLNFLPLKRIAGKADPEYVKLARYRIKNKKEAKFFGHNIGHVMRCDTGWRVAYDVRKAGFKGHCMKGKFTNANDAIPYLWRYEATPFVAHMGGSHRPIPKLFDRWVTSVNNIIRDNINAN